MAEPSPTLSPVSASDTLAQTLPRLQHWIDYVPPRQRRLGLFVFLALMAHLVLFFFIRIDTTRAQLQHATRIHVTVEPTTPAAVAGETGDNFWDRLMDPRLFLMPLNPIADIDAGSPTLDLDSDLVAPHLPASAPPLSYQAAPAVTTPLEQQVAEAMHPPRQPFSYDETPPALAKRTTWQWDAGLAARQPTGFPGLPAPTSDTDLSPTVLSVAVNPNGAVDHVLVEQSCAGDLGATIAKDLDQQAVLAAKKIRFQPTSVPGLQWGRITVFWFYSAKPTEEVVPTPPTTGT